MPLPCSVMNLVLWGGEWTRNRWRNIVNGSDPVMTTGLPHTSTRGMLQSESWTTNGRHSRRNSGSGTPTSRGNASRMPQPQWPSWTKTMSQRIRPRNTRTSQRVQMKQSWIVVFYLLPLLRLSLREHAQREEEEDDCSSGSDDDTHSAYTSTTVASGV